ncbi:unnamed protein product, partial [Staurois parvus]
MQPDRSGKGGMSERPPPPNHTRPHALNTGVWFWAEGAPPSNHLVPTLMGMSASSPQPWAVVVGACGREGLSESGSPL